MQRNDRLPEYAPLSLSAGRRFYRAGNTIMPENYRNLLNAGHFSCSQKAFPCDKLVSELFSVHRGTFRVLQEKCGTALGGIEDELQGYTAERGGAQRCGRDSGNRGHPEHCQTDTSYG